MKVMKQPEESDSLDRMLRERAPYIDDGGFTSRVVAALPRRRQTWWVRPVISLGSVTVGTLLAIRWLPWEHLPRFDVSAILSLNSQVLMPWGVVVLVAASLVWATVSAVQMED